MSNTNDIKNVSMARVGSEIVSTGTYTNGYSAIQVLSDAVVTASGNCENLSSVTLPQNFILLGKFESITITSGTCVLYKDNIK